MEQAIQNDRSKGLNVVVIGGGTGLSTMLSGLKTYVGDHSGGEPCIDSLSAIVTVTDDGGSSGRLRTERQMLPPGDIRNCMVALSEDSLLLSRLFRHRFSGEVGLGGHNFGNLFLAALTEITGDFAEAVRLSSEILASKGHIYPATTADVHLVAELDDGRIVRGETNISKVGPVIKQLKIEPASCDPMPEAIEAIKEADVITVGPGSLFTSLLPPLLVKGVPEAIAASPAVKIFVNNLMTQPGETDGFTSARHLETLRSYAPEIKFDFLLVNNRPITERQRELYEFEGAEQIGVHGSIKGVGIEGTAVMYDNLLDEGDKVRHHPLRLSQAILRCAADNNDVRDLDAEQLAQPASF
jgi:uncharacterized cofD-like protein